MFEKAQSNPSPMKKHRSLASILVVQALLLPIIVACSWPSAAASSDRAFPPIQAAAAGMSTEAIDQIVEHVQTLVDQEEIVGGELLILKDRKTVYRGAFGWNDREAQRPMEVGAVYSVRSMTKPLVGTAIQMLIDEGRLTLATPVAEILPYFDGPQQRRITVEQLLTHRAGLPLTTMGQPLADYEDLEAVVREAASRGLDFEPGAQFSYSDAGSDTLGAIVAEVTGRPVEEFIQRRILDPLGMEETTTLLSEGDESRVRSRVPAAYSGGTGTWIKHWEPSHGPLFPLFLPSQGLYTTTTDYARFLSLWMDRGRWGDQQLLSAEAVARALKPVSAIEGYPSTFDGLEPFYGHQWIVRVDPGAGAASPTIFGHDGSDGTHAWAWPERDLMVLFFTQSRGSLAGIRLERVLQSELIDGGAKSDGPTEVVAESEAQPLDPARLAGLYWDETNETAYYVVTPHPRGVVVERPGRMIELFVSEPGEPGHYVHETNSKLRLEFDLEGEGPAPSMRTRFGKNIEDNPRHRPVEGLPSVDDVVAGVLAAHRIDRLADLGAVRLSGFLTIPAMNAKAKLTTFFDAQGQRTEVEFGSARERTVTDGERAWYYSTNTGLDELTGVRLEQARLDRFSVTFGDWREHFDRVDVLKRLQLKEGSVLLVRAKVPQVPGVTFFVDETTGAVFQTEGLVLLPGMGFVGVQVRFKDLQDVGGMLLPFRSVAEFTAKQIGRIETRLTRSAVGVEVSDETFTAPR